MDLNRRQILKLGAASAGGAVVGLTLGARKSLPMEVLQCNLAAGRELELDVVAKFCGATTPELFSYYANFFPNFSIGNYQNFVGLSSALEPHQTRDASIERLFGNDISDTIRANIHRLLAIPAVSASHFVSTARAATSTEIREAHEVIANGLTTGPSEKREIVIQNLVTSTRSSSAPRFLMDDQLFLGSDVAITSLSQCVQTIEELDRNSVLALHLATYFANCAALSESIGRHDLHQVATTLLRHLSWEPTHNKASLAISAEDISVAAKSVVSRDGFQGIALLPQASEVWFSWSSLLALRPNSKALRSYVMKVLLTKLEGVYSEIEYTPTSSSSLDELSTNARANRAYKNMGWLQHSQIFEHEFSREDFIEAAQAFEMDSGFIEFLRSPLERDYVLNRAWLGEELPKDWVRQFRSGFSGELAGQVLIDATEPSEMQLLKKCDEAHQAGKLSSEALFVEIGQALTNTVGGFVAGAALPGTVYGLGKVAKDTVRALRSSNIEDGAKSDSTPNKLSNFSDEVRENSEEYERVITQLDALRNMQDE